MPAGALRTAPRKSRPLYEAATDAAFENARRAARRAPGRFPGGALSGQASGWRSRRPAHCMLPGRPCTTHRLAPTNSTRLGGVQPRAPGASLGMAAQSLRRWLGRRSRWASHLHGAATHSARTRCKPSPQCTSLCAPRDRPRADTVFKVRYHTATDYGPGICIRDRIPYRTVRIRIWILHAHQNKTAVCPQVQGGRSLTPGRRYFFRNK